MPCIRQIMQQMHNIPRLRFIACSGDALSCSICLRPPQSHDRPDCPRSGHDCLFLFHDFIFPPLYIMILYSSNNTVHCLYRTMARPLLNSAMCCFSLQYRIMTSQLQNISGASRAQRHRTLNLIVN